jgi:hypothetical protein
MPQTVFGLPLHPLIVHATVVVVPAAALVVLLSVVWPRFRAWAGWLPMALSAAAVVLVPMSTSSGESLEETVPETALIEQHAHLADQLLPFTIALLVLSVAHWWLVRHRPTRRGLSAVVAGLAVLAAVGTGVEVARIGHSGAEAAWASTASGGRG